MHTYDRDGLKFVWEGGEYIDILSQNVRPITNNKGEVGNEHHQFPGWYFTYDVINVSNDNVEGQAGFERVVDEWLAEQ